MKIIKDDDRKYERLIIICFHWISVMKIKGQIWLTTCNCLYSCNDIFSIITNSVLNSPCFAWHPYGKLELFKTE